VSNVGAARRRCQPAALHPTFAHSHQPCVPMTLSRMGEASMQTIANCKVRLGAVAVYLIYQEPANGWNALLEEQVIGMARCRDEGLCRGPVERASASTATGLRHLYVFRDVKPRVDEIVLFSNRSRHVDRNAGKKARDAIRLKPGHKPSITGYNQHG